MEINKDILNSYVRYLILFHKKNHQRQRQWHKGKTVKELVIGYQTFIYPPKILPAASPWAPKVVTHRWQYVLIWRSPNNAPSISHCLASGWTVALLEVSFCRPFLTTGTRLGVKLWLGRMKRDLSHAPSNVNVCIFVAMPWPTFMIRWLCPFAKLVTEMHRLICFVNNVHVYVKKTYIVLVSCKHFQHML